MATKIKVEYFGEDYEVPSWAEFMATDGDGDIYAYDSRPFLDGSSFWECDGANKLVDTGRADIDYEDSLEVVSLCRVDNGISIKKMLEYNIKIASYGFNKTIHITASSKQCDKSIDIPLKEDEIDLNKITFELIEELDSLSNEAEIKRKKEATARKLKWEHDRMMF